MEFNLYDIYVDASIDLERKVGCAGLALVDRKQDKLVDTQYIIRDNATNNMCEIMAIWMGVYRAINLIYTDQLAFLVNIFSDSKISLFGMREWIPSWIKNRRGDLLWSTTGPVANQEWFIDAYQAILSSGIKLKFWHQKGHVNENEPNSLFISDKTFRKSNVHSPHMIKTTPQILAKYNNFVDKTSREILYKVILDGVDFRTIPNVSFISGNPMPMIYEIQDDTLERYEAQIKGGLNYPIYFGGK